MRLVVANEERRAQLPVFGSLSTSSWKLTCCNHLLEGRMSLTPSPWLATGYKRRRWRLAYWRVPQRVWLLENAVSVWGEVPIGLNTTGEPMVRKYREGKMKSTLVKGLTART